VRRESGSLISPFLQLAFFNLHVFELAGFEDVAAFQAFHEFGVIFAGDNFHPRVLTWGHLASHTVSWAGLDEVIDSGWRRPAEPPDDLAELAVFLAGRARLSSKKCS
jgi:hypothetical protein